MSINWWTAKLVDRGDGYVEVVEDEDDWGEEDEDKPECCIACGGPYPDCADSCKIFEDD